MQSFIPPAAPVPTKADVARRIGRTLSSEALLRLRDHRPLRPGSVPRRPTQLTADWLTGVLCRDVPAARVSRLDWVGVQSVGTTTRRAARVTYNEAGAGLPRELFVKCTSSVAQRLMLGMGGLITGEPGFYDRVRPHLEIEAPAGYFGSVDPRSWRSVVIMEDVAATRGARFWRPETPVSRAEIEDLLSNVAGWHGALWESPALDDWNWLRTPADQARLIDALIALADRTGTGARRAEEVIPPSLRPRQSDLFEGMRRSLTLAGRRPHTYLHGDLHAANTYLTQDRRMGICDWQVGLRGSWSYDFAYLLITALDVGDRRAWERDLLRFYLERLAAGGGSAPDPAEAWQAYRQATLYPYFAWIYTLGRARLQPRFQPEQVSLTMIARISAAIDDLDSLGAIGL